MKTEMHTNEQMATVIRIFHDAGVQVGNVRFLERAVEVAIGDRIFDEGLPFYKMGAAVKATTGRDLQLCQW